LNYTRRCCCDCSVLTTIVIISHFNGNVNTFLKFFIS